MGFSAAASVGAATADSVIGQMQTFAPDEQMKVSKQILNVSLLITCMCSLIHSVQQHHCCWLVILNVSRHMFYATEDPDLRAKGHVVGFGGPLCFF